LGGEGGGRASSEEEVLRVSKREGEGFRRRGEIEEEEESRRGESELEEGRAEVGMKKEAW